MIEVIAQTIPQDHFGSFSLESFQCVGLLPCEINPGCGGILELWANVQFNCIYLIGVAYLVRFL